METFDGHPLAAAHGRSLCPFGKLLKEPFGPGRVNLDGALANRREGAEPQLALIRAAPASLPLTVMHMERHLFSAQIFVPIEVGRFVVLVAPGGGDTPESAALKGFLATTRQAISYDPGVWHHSLTVLDRPARFALVINVDGGGQDEQFVDLAEAVRLFAL